MGRGRREGRGPGRGGGAGGRAGTPGRPYSTRSPVALGRRRAQPVAVPAREVSAASVLFSGIIDLPVRRLGLADGGPSAGRLYVEGARAECAGRARGEDVWGGCAGRAGGEDCAEGAVRMLVHLAEAIRAWRSWAGLPQSKLNGKGIGSIWNVPFLSGERGNYVLENECYRINYFIQT